MLGELSTTFHLAWPTFIATVSQEVGGVGSGVGGVGGVGVEMGSGSGYRGEIAALVAAFFWAISTTIWSHAGKQFPPLVLNFIKGVIGLIFICVTLFILKDSTWVTSPEVFWLFVISGALGLGLGDTMYFECINRIGPRLGLMLLFTAPPITAVIAWIFLDEKISFLSWVGIVITMSGIAWVVTERRPEEPFKRHHIKAGVIFGLVAGLMQAVGAVITHAAFGIADENHLKSIAMLGENLGVGEISALSSSMIRMGAGLVFLFIWLIIRNRLRLLPGQLKQSRRLWGLILIAVFFGTFLGIWLQQVAFDEAKVGIAQTLLATSPIFILPLGWLYREKISWRAVVGAFVTLAGIALLMSQE